MLCGPQLSYDDLRLARVLLPLERDRETVFLECVQSE